MSHAKGRVVEDRIHTPHSPFAAVASLQEPNLLSHSEILKATTDRINKVKDPLHENALVAYEFIEESTAGWRWSIGEVKEFTEHTVTIQKWRCAKGSNADLVDALRRDQLVKTKLLKESSQSIFSLRAELGSVRTKNEAEMARARSELQDRQEPLSVADDGVWKTILSAAGSSKPGARSVQQLITTVVGLIDQRFPNQVLSWVDVQRAAQHISFLDRVYRYDVWYDMSTEQFKVAKELLDEDEDLQPASFERSVRDVGLRGEAASYAESLYLWLTAQVQVFTTYLGCASTQEYANSLQQQLFDCVQNLKELNRKLAQIKQELELYAKGGVGIQGSKSGNKQASLTFVPTSGIFSTILRSSIVLVLREKSTEVVVLGNEDVDEILECSGHHRPNLHAVAGELIQLTSGVNSEGERRKASEDLEDLRNRLADVQKELEAQREESLASDQEVQGLRKLLQQEKEKRDERIRGENEELKRLQMESAQLKKEAKEVEKEMALRETKQLEEVKLLRAENKNLQEELQIAEKEHSLRDSAQLDDVKTLQKDNAKLRDEIREKEKEILKQDGKEKEELKELRSENRKLRDEVREKEREISKKDGKEGEELKELRSENRKLRDEVREKEKEISKQDGKEGEELKELRSENRKLRNEVREKEKEISKKDGKEGEELKELRSENRKLREEVRKAEQEKSKRTETRRSVEEDEAMKVLKEENRKLRDDLRRSEREKRKSIPTSDGIDGSSRRYSSTRELEEERKKNKALDSSLRASVDEIEYLQEKLRELQRQPRGHSSPSQGMSSSGFQPFFSSNNNSGGLSFANPLDNLMWQEKCARVKIENNMNHLWVSFVALDRDVLFSLSQRRAQELLEELDVLSFDYTDSLEKLEEFIGFIEDARNSEIQLRTRLTATEDALIHLQSFCDQYELARKVPSLAAAGETIGTNNAQWMNSFAPAAGSRDPRVSAKRQDFSALLQKGEAIRRQIFEKTKENEERKKRNEYIKHENEELLQLVKRLPAAGHRSQAYGEREDRRYGDSPSRSPYGGWSQGSRMPSNSDRKVDESGEALNTDEASFKEVFLRMKGQMEKLKQQKEALTSELDDRDQEIERIQQYRLWPAPDRLAVVG